jgi:HK97 family phage prohead protease
MADKLPASKLEDIDRRVFRGAEVRAGERDGKPVIEGYAAVFNEESQDLGGFVEILEPGAFDDALDQDTVGLWNHNDDIPLGRTKNKTLEIAQDSKGLKYTIFVNQDDMEAMSKHAKVKRGDVNGSSFAFRVKSKERGDEMNGDEWKLVGEAIVRVIKKGGIRDLFDVSPVTYPAYSKASSQARSQAESLKHSLENADPDASAQAGGGASDGEPQVQALLAPFDQRIAIMRRKYQLPKEQNHESP